MELPIPFPSEGDRIVEEVARFQALTPEEQVREVCRVSQESINELIRSGRYEEWNRQHTEQHIEGMRKVIELGIKLAMINEEELGLEEPFICSKA
jgi:hypothetical protein